MLEAKVVTHIEWMTEELPDCNHPMINSLLPRARISSLPK